MKKAIAKLFILMGLFSAMLCVTAGAAGSWSSDNTALTLKYDDRYTFDGYQIVSLGEGIPTSYQVGYGIGENTRDVSVLSSVNGSNTVIARGIGTTTVTLSDGQNTLYKTVYVEPAPISLFLIAGQSNAEGAQGDRNTSVKCEEGQVYSTYALSKVSDTVCAIGGYSTSASPLTVSNAEDFVASSLTSTVNSKGTTIEFPLNSLTGAGQGKMGFDAALAYRWGSLANEKVWVVNAAHSGSAISTWLPNTGENYNEAVAIFKKAQQVLKSEIAAGHYRLGKMGYFWLQGESDTAMSAVQYVDYFKRMHQGFGSQFAGDIDSDGTADTIRFAGILIVRAFTQTNTYTELQMNGPRLAQYYMGNTFDNGLENVYLVGNSSDQWVAMGNENPRSGINAGVANYFNAKYPNGINYPLREGAALAVPQNAADVNSNAVHYAQVGYNEMGLEAAENTVAVINNQTTGNVSVKLVSNDGYTPLNNTQVRLDQYRIMSMVPIISPLYMARGAAIEVSNHAATLSDIYQLTGNGASGNVTVTNGSASAMFNIVGEPAEPIGMTWTYSNGILEIGGSGDMTSFTKTDYTTRPWHQYQNQITKVVIHPGITSIGGFAFADCVKLSTIEIPNTVTKIGDVALRKTAMTDMVIPNSVLTIGWGAFYACPKLKSVTIPEGVTGIDMLTFAECKLLEKVVIPASVIYVYSSTNHPFLNSNLVVIYCHAGTAAETFAINKGIPYSILP